MMNYTCLTCGSTFDDFETASQHEYERHPHRRSTVEIELNFDLDNIIVEIEQEKIIIEIDSDK